MNCDKIPYIDKTVLPLLIGLVMDGINVNLDLVQHKMQRNKISRIQILFLSLNT